MYCTADYITQALVAGHMIGIICVILYLLWNDRAIWSSFAYAAMAQNTWLLYLR